LGTGADRDADGKIHLVLAREDDGVVELRYVVDQGEKEDAGKDGSKAERLGGGLDRPRHHLAHDGESKRDDDKEANRLDAVHPPVGFFDLIRA
jgi:hypothetical protein